MGNSCVIRVPVPYVMEVAGGRLVPECLTIPAGAPDLGVCTTRYSTISTFEGKGLKDLATHGALRCNDDEVMASFELDTSDAMSNKKVRHGTDFHSLVR